MCYTRRVALAVSVSPNVEAVGEQKEMAYSSRPVVGVLICFTATMAMFEANTSM
jgi:hypothetical protein